ncbi:MAG: proline racemase family protein, partial [Brachybacterium sp.]
MRRERSITLIDTQSGGDVSRVVTAGIKELPGDSVLEQARYLQREGDGLRRLLLSEPYGDPAMSVDLIVAPRHPEAQAGYIIMEAMGYPLYSGSNTICVATALLESGMIEMTG